VEGARATGTFATRADVVPLPGAQSDVSIAARSINYLAVVWPALLFGILISAAVRTFVSPAWLVAAFNRRPARAHLAAGLAGAPLMLCSCCVAPIFSAAYERSSRLGPSLALMLAAPALNPAALALTFMLFPPRVGWTRFLLAITAVFVATAFSARLVHAPSASAAGGEAATPAPADALSVVTALLRSSLHVMVRTVPPILVGIAVAMLIADRLPVGIFASSASRVGTIAVVALVMVPLALPTFFEIPIGLALLAAGAPVGAALAVLFVGPVVNLPSLFTIARSTSWKVSAAVATTVWLLGFLGGVLVG
jgi:hypothetical protein